MAEYRFEFAACNETDEARVASVTRLRLIEASTGCYIEDKDQTVSVVKRVIFCVFPALVMVDDQTTKGVIDALVVIERGC